MKRVLASPTIIFDVSSWSKNSALVTPAVTNKQENYA
jgi:hypothetical protein